MKLLKNRRIIRDFLVFGFAAYGFLWMVVESYGAYFEDSKLEGIYWFTAFVSTSVVWGLWCSRPRYSVDIQIPVSDSSIEIIFGDIFEGEGVVVIPVNEYFDGSLGDHVSKNSLHGKFIQEVLKGQSRRFNELTSKALKSIPSVHVERNNGRKARFPIGTVAKLDVNGKRFLLAALTHTNIDTLKASATVNELWTCLNGTWRAVRDFSKGDCVKMPLLGSGLSGVGLPPRNLIEVILLSFVEFTKKRKIADKVTLVLPKRLKGEIDLITIKRGWK